MKKIFAIITTILVSLLCGLPGIILTGIGLLGFISALLFPELVDTSQGTQQEALLGSLVLIVPGIILIVIPIVIGVLTLRKKKPSVESYEIPSPVVMAGYTSEAMQAPAIDNVSALTWEPQLEDTATSDEFEDTDEAGTLETFEAKYVEGSTSFKDKRLPIHEWSTYLNIGDEGGVQENYEQVCSYAKRNPPAFPLYIERVHMGEECVLALIYPLRNEDNELPDQPSYKTISGWLEDKEPWRPFGAWHSSFTGTGRLREYCMRVTSVDENIYFEGR